jgi:DNA polymerase I
MPAAQKARPAAAAKPLKKGDHVFLVDGSAYIFRAYHALPPINRKSDGLQLNAVFGFCNMLWKLFRDMKPDERPTHLARTKSGWWATLNKAEEMRGLAFSNL